MRRRVGRAKAPEKTGKTRGTSRRESSRGSRRGGGKHQVEGPARRFPRMHTKRSIEPPSADKPKRGLAAMLQRGEGNGSRRSVKAGAFAAAATAGLSAAALARRRRGAE